MELARWRLVFGRIHVMIMIVGLILINYLGLLKDAWELIRFNAYGIIYVLVGIILEVQLHRRRLKRRLNQADLEVMIPVYRIYLLAALASKQQFAIFHSFAGIDGWERLCYSVLPACWWVMVILNCLETLFECLMFAAPSWSVAMAVPVGDGVLRVPLGFFGGVTGVLIRCGRVLGGFDNLVARRLSLGTMGVALLTVVSGGFGSMMTVNVLWTCLGLGFLETILICASRQVIFAVCVRVRYVIISGLKIGLVIFSVMNNNLHSLTKSRGCEVGSACYSRLRECFWVMLVFYFLELFFAVLLLCVDETRQEIHGNPRLEWCERVKHFEDISERSRTISLVLSMAQIAIGGLILGGSYGPLMTSKGFWFCGSILFTEMGAPMVIGEWEVKFSTSEIDIGISISKRISVIRSSLVIWMMRILMIGSQTLRTNDMNGEDLFIADMSNCDESCKARGRDLLGICRWTFVVQYLFILGMCIFESMSIFKIRARERLRELSNF